MPHAVLHEDRRLKKAVFWHIDDALDAVLYRVARGVGACLSRFRERQSWRRLVGLCGERVLNVYGAQPLPGAANVFEGGLDLLRSVRIGWFLGCEYALAHADAANKSSRITQCSSA